MRIVAIQEGIFIILDFKNLKGFRKIAQFDVEFAYPLLTSMLNSSSLNAFIYIKLI